MTDAKKKIHISAIDAGTSIDHIPVGKALKILEVLELENLGVMTIALNVNSKKMGKKDLIFIENKELNQKEIDKIRLLAKDATLNVIKDYKVVKKEKMAFPDNVEGVIKCINPNCITNVEGIATKFSLEKHPLRASCYYCETVMEDDEIVQGIK